MATYDNDWLDPRTNPTLQPSGPDSSKLAGFRQAADRARFYEDQTDTNVLADPRYAHYFNTGEYRPSSQAFPDNEKEGANFGQGAAASPRDAALQQTSQVYSNAAQQSQIQGVPTVAASPFTSGLRDILMKQLGVYSQAPTVNDPGIAENLAGRRLALQRSAERQQSASAESRGLMGLSDSGAADTERLGIEQARGEAEARGVGDVLGGEFQNRRAVLMNLLNSALQSGDTESARALQLQLAQMGDETNRYSIGVNQGIAQGQLGLGQDQLGFQYADLNARNNMNTLLALLNAS